MSNIANYFNPAPCNNGALAAMSALASTTNSFTAPYPLLYTASKCGGGVTGASFPLYFLPMNCNNPITTPADNCLRVISNAEYNDGKTLLHSSMINYLPFGTEQGTMFSNLNDRLYSWYVPPQYTFIFFLYDPSTDIPNNIPRLEQSGNYLQVDACLGVPYLSDGTAFFEPIPTAMQCQSITPDAFNHTSPFLVVIQNENYTDMVVEMCTLNRKISIGTNSLNDVWFPQSPGCDSYMKNLCALSNIANSEFAEVCACFTQQAQLEKLHPGINVSVCSFGSEVSGDISKSCAFNTVSYKTSDMLKNCVSFAQCESNTDTNSLIKCMGEFVSFPKNAVVTPTVTPAVYTSSTSLPSFAWIILGLAAAALLVCFLVLAFV